MIKAFSFPAAAVLAGMVAVPGQAAAESPDTFVTIAILENLSDAENAEEFEKRLRDEAQRYCEREAPNANRRQLRRCEEEIVAAVAEALEEQNVVVAWNY
ncbi:UrcA family protein [Parvularcula maris]|uniref:UrcA family protein n=1 Tax=Parvularcula maris TaxID=2965077 RepID=A0A9X2RK35_9PROT|nr:UrcA family protein [Parvularcula maris]MCQ8186526.1 UrcA family protein [Parvularcula maris]